MGLDRPPRLAGCQPRSKFSERLHLMRTTRGRVRRRGGQLILSSGICIHLHRCVCTSEHTDIFINKGKSVLERNSEACNSLSILLFLRSFCNTLSRRCQQGQVPRPGVGLVMGRLAWVKDNELMTVEVGDVPRGSSRRCQRHQAASSFMGESRACRGSRGSYRASSTLSWQLGTCPCGSMVSLVQASASHHPWI